MHRPIGNHNMLTIDPPSPSPDDDLKIRSASEYPARPVEWLWPEKIPIGKVTLLIGDPGLGKSLVALDIAARVSRGTPWPEQEAGGGELGAGNSKPEGQPSLPDSPLRAPRSVLLLSAEDDIADTIRPRLDAHGADPHRVYFLPTLADLRHDFRQLEAALERLPDCGLIVVDPVNAYVGATDSHFHTIVRKVLAPLAELAAKKRIAILAVTHLRKNTGAAIYRATGSMGFVAAARSVWTICRDNDDPRRNLLLPVKNNLGPVGCGLAYTIESDATTGAPVVRWQTQSVDLSAEEALTPPPKPRGPEAEDRRLAGEWLKKVLANGPQESWRLIHEAKEFGFGERTLQRALRAIGGETTKHGYLSGWLWSLPQHQAPAEQANRDQADIGLDAKKPVAFDVTCRLRENPEKNASPNQPESAPSPSPPPDSKEHDSLTGSPILDRMLAGFCSSPSASPTADHRQQRRKNRSQKKRNKKNARSHSRLPREPTPGTSSPASQA